MIALRIDEVRVNPGSIEVFYTHGQTPLPVERSGNAFSLASRQEAVAIKNAVQIDEFSLFRIALAIYARAANDPNLTSARNIEGHTLTLDVTNPNAILSYA
jgi:hypothetical protein